MDNEHELSLTTLDDVVVWRGQVRVDDRLPVKAIAILVYTAEHGGRVRRSTMAGLLWSDQTEERARANLRVTLSRLRREVGTALKTDREWIELVGNVQLDAARLPTLTPDEITSTYKTDFLYGLELSGAALFDDWMTARRADIRATALARLCKEANTAHRSAQWSRCEQIGRAIVGIEPWHEQAHQWIIESLAHTSGSAVAQAHYSLFAAGLLAELGAEPDPRTAELAVAATDVEHRTGQTRPIVIPDQAQPPRWTTPLIGRTEELVDLKTRVREGRPLSIVGPGGIGKSRLLGEFATAEAEAGASVVFVSFDSHAPTTSAQTDRAFAETVLVSLGVPADSELGPAQSLYRHLRTSDAILCLDNLEHLAGVEASLVELGNQCPSVAIVLTTRRLPALVHGQVLELHGLAHRHDGENLSPAEDLFLDRAAARVHNDDDLGRIGDICEALDGHPLAIELAAHWAETASIAELAELLQAADAGPAFETSAPDVPMRHRSLDVIVSASVAQVSPEARRFLRAAAFFAGPFARADVEAMVPTLGSELAELVRHSLVVSGDSHYHLHPVIRRFARYRLESPDRVDELARRHASQLVSVMGTIRDPLSSGLRFQRRAADLRAAIDWLIDAANPADLMPPLTVYLGFQRAWGWFASSMATIAKALERSDLPAVARAELHRHAAEAMLHGALYDEAAVELEHGLDLVGARIPNGKWRRRGWNMRQALTLVAAPVRRTSAAARDRAAERARLMSLLGEVFYVSDRRTEMMSYGLGSLSSGRMSRDPVLAAAGDAGIAVACQLAGAHGLADRYRKRARRPIVNATRNPFTASEMWGIAALVAVGSGDWDDARADIASALAEGAASGRTRMISQLEILLALVDYHQGRYDDASIRLGMTEAAIDQNGFRRALTWVHSTAAESALAAGDLDVARHRATRALDTAASSGRPEDAARAHVSLARCALRTDDMASAFAALTSASFELATPGALAIQHFELHCSGVETARQLSLHEPDVRDVVEQFARQSAVFAKSFPIAERRLRQGP